MELGTSSPPLPYPKSPALLEFSKFKVETILRVEFNSIDINLKLKKWHACFENSLQIRPNLGTKPSFSQQFNF